MKLGDFLNEYILARVGARLQRTSVLQRQEEDRATLRQSLRQMQRDNASLRKSERQLRKYDAAVLQRSIAKTQKQFTAIAGRLDELGKSNDNTRGQLAELLEHFTAIAERLDELRKSNDNTRGQLAELLVGFAELHVDRRLDAQGLESSGAQEEFLKLARHFSPRAAVGQRKIRLGRPNDGGYVMLEDFEGIAAAFSFGVADDASWDLDIACRNILTYQLDHTIASAPATHPNLKFIRRKIVSEPSEDGETIAGLLSKYGSDAGALHLMKMDIEGDEWSIFARAEPEHLRRFAQIVCEFHNFSQAADRSWYSRAQRVMEKLSNDFEVVHVHGNNCTPLITVANVSFPETLEVTFANRACYQFNDCDDLFPTPLDQPNSPQGADLFLGRFKF
jgi:hypothetical protein